VPGGASNKCGSIPMESLIAAVARALEAGDPLGALNRVALRDDAAALALRGIAMVQYGFPERDSDEREVRIGSKCEELSMSKPSPLHVHERTSMQRAATSPTGPFSDSCAAISRTGILERHPSGTPAIRMPSMTRSRPARKAGFSLHVMVVRKRRTVKLGSRLHHRPCLVRKRGGEMEMRD
jgi:hypothetical protein